jgi:hypothetical protein
MRLERGATYTQLLKKLHNEIPKFLIIWCVG